MKDPEVVYFGDDELRKHTRIVMKEYNKIQRVKQREKKSKRKLVKASRRKNMH